MSRKTYAKSGTLEETLKSINHSKKGELHPALVTLKDTKLEVSGSWKLCEHCNNDLFRPIHPRTIGYHEQEGVSFWQCTICKTPYYTKNTRTKIWVPEGSDSEVPPDA